MPTFRTLIPKSDFPLPKEAPKQTRNRHTDAEWDDLKPTILQLYLRDKMTAPLILEMLNKEYGFKTSLRSLRQKLNQWQCGKNLSHNDMLYVLAKSNQRRSQGKNTEFFYHGQALTGDRLGRFLQRGGPSDSSVNLCNFNLPNTPEGVSYQSPVSGNSASPFPSSPPLVIEPGCKDLPRELLCCDDAITITLGYMRASEPDPCKITHKHQVGKLAMMLRGVKITADDQRRILRRAYEIAVDTRNSMKLTSHLNGVSARGLSVENTMQIDSLFVCSPTDSWDDDLMKRCMLQQILKSRLFRQGIRLISGSDEELCPSLRPLSKEDGAEMKYMVDRAVGADFRHYPTSKSLEIYIRVPRRDLAGVVFARFSLFIEVQPGPKCSVCEVDVLTAHFLNSTAGISINVPLTQGLEPLHTRTLGPLDIISKTGAWNEVVSHIMGFESLAACRVKHSSQENFHCIDRYEIPFEQGGWDPLGKSERQQTFQAYPLHREHICSNRCSNLNDWHQVDDSGEFDAYPVDPDNHLSGSADDEWNPSPNGS
ncbi:hypothetical protein JX266_011104 [Neoarthrinium moseri]|nr:hypothetical protein JX266_011104 [Neoarthrinium moseri]